ncbi:hypothetical protein ACQ4M4_13295 [Leptolyngbya sp. AN02str]
MVTATPIKVSSKEETRILLTVWTLGGSEAEVNKGEVTRRIKRPNEKSIQYESSFDRLEAVQAITINRTQKRSPKISLSPKGVEMLVQGLNPSNFQFNAQIGAKTANALLKLIGQRWLEAPRSETNRNSGQLTEAIATITTYEEFKNTVVDVYERLNRDYNYDNLVPIYRIRREVGEKVSRPQFNDWMLELQSNDVFQLLEGSVEDSAPDKIEDSVTTKLGKLRCYAKHLYP